MGGLLVPCCVGGCRGAGLLGLGLVLVEAGFVVAWLVGVGTVVVRDPAGFDAVRAVGVSEDAFGGVIADGGD